MITIVDNMHKDFSDLIKSLEEKGDISFRNVADDNFRKSLLLCAASFFEKTLCENVSNFIEIKSGNNRAIVEFVKNKAINRQYHTWFSWKEKNANSFFGLFGEDFKTFIQEKIKSDPGMERSIKAFMDLGQERNRLVHQDYGTFYMEKTSEEIFDMYREALKFVLSVKDFLDDFTELQNSSKSK